MVWYSYLFKSFPQFIMVHTVKGFGIVNKAEIDVFLELLHKIPPKSHQSRSPKSHLNHLN